MSRASLTLNNKARRLQALSWVQKAPDGTRLIFQEARRTDDQNRLMWDLLTDIAKQVPWHGVRLSADDYKLIFLAALNQEMRLVPNLDNTGFVSLGRSSSKLSKAEMSNLIELLLMFCAERGVMIFDSDRDAAGGETNPAAVAAA